MWESGGHCEVEGEKPKLGEKKEDLEKEDVFEEELEEEDVFEEEQNVIDDTISNFETIFTQAEKESFQRTRKKRNTIEMFDDMFDALDITVVEEVSDHVEETDQDSINLLKCVNTDVSIAVINLTEASKETLEAEVPSSEIGAIVEQLFSCNQCEKTFATETSLKKHIGKDHKIKSSGRYPCPECEWTGANKGVVKTHIKKRHR